VPHDRSNAPFVLVTGTSFAAPHVSGAAALGLNERVQFPGCFLGSAPGRGEARLPAVVRRAIRIAPQNIAMAGLGLAIGSGLAAPLTGRPFLTGIWWIWKKGQVEELAIGTPLLFDAGVFFAVLGTILTLILALEEN